MPDRAPEDAVMWMRLQALPTETPDDPRSLPGRSRPASLKDAEIALKLC
jgi:hypothetical protein